MPSAAVVIIGNEILTGKFRDENGPYFIERLRTLGTDLVRLSVIPDEVDAIADEVRRCAALADFVFTSGGVGPTHDDVTMEGVAAAFGRGVEVREELAAILDRFDMERTPATLRLATVPEGADLIENEALSYPVVRCENVHILPGVPKLLRNKFEAIAHHFAGERVVTARLYCDERETEMADRLAAVAVAHPSVAIGSYPRFGEGPYRVILTLESRDVDALAQARRALEERLSLVSAEVML